MSIIKRTITLLDKEFHTNSETWVEACTHMLTDMDGLYHLTLTGKAISKLGKGYIHILDIGAVSMPNSWIFFGGKDLFHAWTMEFSLKASYMVHINAKSEMIPSLGGGGHTLAILGLQLHVSKIEPAAEGSNVVYRQVEEPEPEPPLRNILL